MSRATTASVGGCHQATPPAVKPLEIMYHHVPHNVCSIFLTRCCCCSQSRVEEVTGGTRIHGNWSIKTHTSAIVVAGKSRREDNNIRGVVIGFNYLHARLGAWRRQLPGLPPSENFGGPGDVVSSERRRRRWRRLSLFD